MRSTLCPLIGHMPPTLASDWSILTQTRLYTNLTMIFSWGKHRHHDQDRSLEQNVCTALYFSNHTRTLACYKATGWMGSNIYGILHLHVYPFNDPQKAHMWYSAQTQVSSERPKRLMRFKWIIRGKILLLMFAARPGSINVMIRIMLLNISGGRKVWN